MSDPQKITPKELNAFLAYYDTRHDMMKNRCSVKPDEIVKELHKVEAFANIVNNPIMQLSEGSDEEEKVMNTLKHLDPRFDFEKCSEITLPLLHGDMNKYESIMANDMVKVKLLKSSAYQSDVKALLQLMFGRDIALHTDCAILYFYKGYLDNNVLMAQDMTTDQHMDLDSLSMFKFNTVAAYWDEASKDIASSLDVIIGTNTEGVLLKENAELFMPKDSHLTINFNLNDDDNTVNVEYGNKEYNTDLDTLKKTDVSISVANLCNYLNSTDDYKASSVDGIPRLLSDLKANNDKANVVFNLKRSLDYGQVLTVQFLNSKLTDNAKRIVLKNKDCDFTRINENMPAHILITFDRLCFMKALQLRVPVIFQRKRGDYYELFLYRGQFERKPIFKLQKLISLVKETEQDLSYHVNIASLPVLESTVTAMELFFGKKHNMFNDQLANDTIIDVNFIKSIYNRLHFSCITILSHIQYIVNSSTWGLKLDKPVAKTFTTLHDVYNLLIEHVQYNQLANINKFYETLNFMSSKFLNNIADDTDIPTLCHNALVQYSLMRSTIDKLLFALTHFKILKTQPSDFSILDNNLYNRLFNCYFSKSFQYLRIDSTKLVVSKSVIDKTMRATGELVATDDIIDVVVAYFVKDENDADKKRVINELIDALQFKVSKYEHVVFNAKTKASRTKLVNYSQNQTLPPAALKQIKSFKDSMLKIDKIKAKILKKAKLTKKDLTLLEGYKSFNAVRELMFKLTQQRRKIATQERDETVDKRIIMFVDMILSTLENELNVATLHSVQSIQDVRSFHRLLREKVDPVKFEEYMVNLEEKLQKNYTFNQAKLLKESATINALEDHGIIDTLTGFSEVVIEPDIKGGDPTLLDAFIDDAVFLITDSILDSIKDQDNNNANEKTVLSLYTPKECHKFIDDKVQTMLSDYSNMIEQVNNGVDIPIADGIMLEEKLQELQRQCVIVVCYEIIYSIWDRKPMTIEDFETSMTQFAQFVVIGFQEENYPLPTLPISCSTEACQSKLTHATHAATVTVSGGSPNNLFFEDSKKSILRNPHPKKKKASSKLEKHLSNKIQKIVLEKLYTHMR